MLAAVDDGTAQVVGTARTNLLKHGRLEFYEHLYGLTANPNFDEGSTAITTRLMVAASHRGRNVTLRLATALYDLGRLEQIAHDYIDCNDPVRSIFERLGYRWLAHIDHPEYGRVNLMGLDIDDVERLRAVKSPFLGRRKNHNG